MPKTIVFGDVERWKNGSLATATEMVDEAKAINRRAIDSKGVKMPFNQEAFGYFSDADFTVIDERAGGSRFAERTFDWDGGSVDTGIYNKNRVCSWLVPRTYFELWNQSQMDGEFAAVHLFGNAFSRYESERSAAQERREALGEELSERVSEADLALAGFMQEEKERLRDYDQKFRGGNIGEVEYAEQINLSVDRIRYHKARLLTECSEFQDRVNRLIETDERKVAQLKLDLQKLVIDNQDRVVDSEREKLAAYRGVTDTRWSLYATMLEYKRWFKGTAGDVGKDFQKLGREVSKIFGFLTSFGSARDTAQVIYGPIGARVNGAYGRITGN